MLHYHKLKKLKKIKKKKKDKESTKSKDLLITKIMSDSEAPLLPQRRDETEDVATIEQELPDLPPSGPLRFRADDSFSYISLVRQLELYRSSLMNNCYDILLLDPVVSKHEFDEENSFWQSFLNDYSDEIIRNGGVAKLESEIILGIPSQLRPRVYYKVLDIRYKFSSKRLLEKYIKADEGTTLTPEETVGVVYSFLKDVGEDIDDQQLRKILGNSAKLVNFTNEENFFILLKLFQYFQTVKQNEFTYKANRALEDSLLCYSHLSSQGVVWNLYYKNVFALLLQKFQETLLDLLVFEGIDVVLRILLWCFVHHQEDLRSLAGDELLHFISSDEFFDSAQGKFAEILALDPPVISYENEFYLITANSLSNNRNELTNLQEIHQDLVVKIDGMKNKIDQLQLTHTEILDHNKRFTGDLATASEENAALNEKMNFLQQKYETLTMKQNLKNTLQANEEFSQRNADLKQQVEKLRKTIELKRTKLAKFV